MRNGLWSIRTMIIGGMFGLILATAAVVLSVLFLVGRSAADAAPRPQMAAALADIVERSQRYLASAEQTATLTQGLLEANAALSDEPDRLKRLLFEVVRGQPAIAAAHYEKSNGSSVFVARNPPTEPEGYLAKTTTVADGARRIALERHDRSFRLIENAKAPTDPADLIDPWTRPWLAAAAPGRQGGWTEPYVSWTSREPKISVARRIECGAASGTARCVVAVDLPLSQLSSFLARLRVGRSGTAFILTRSNRVVALSRPGRLVAEERAEGARDPSPRLKQSNELDDPALAAAVASLGTSLDEAAWSGTQQTRFAVGQRRYLAAFAPFDSQGLPWLVGIYLPETDVLEWFFGQQRGLFYLGLLVAALATLLAALLSYHLIRPLERIRANAVRVSEGCLDALTLPRSRLIELRETEEAIAAMAQCLSEHRQAMAMALEQSLQAGQAKSEFLARMSHELRTPLNAIIGFTDLIDMRLAKTGAEREREYLRDMRSAGEQLLGVLARILQFASLEDGRLSLDEGRFLLDECIRGACQPLQRLSTDKGLAMTFAVEPEVWVRGDLAKLRQAVGNVLSNAIRFTPVGGEASITARRHADGGVEVVVRDSGLGMTDEEARLALQPFLRAAANPYLAGEGGMGLGLPIARALCELHDGTLTVASRRGVGTTVTLSLPAARVLPARPAIAANQALPAAIPGACRGPVLR